MTRQRTEGPRHVTYIGRTGGEVGTCYWAAEVLVAFYQDSQSPLEPQGTGGQTGKAKKTIVEFIGLLCLNSKNEMTARLFLK